MARIWLTSDTHFCHKNILKYEDRPFSDTEVMNTELIRRWNEVVAPEDTVIHLGDVALGPADRFYPLVGALNGHKVLVTGNHDMKPLHWYNEHGFDVVYEHMVMLYARDRKILLTHIPRFVYGENYDLHFYGHVHSKGHHGEHEGDYPTIARNGACVCVERWNYYPVDLDKLIELCEKAPNFCPNI